MTSRNPTFQPRIQRTLFTRAYYAKHVALRLVLLCLVMAVAFIAI